MKTMPGAGVILIALAAVVVASTESGALRWGCVAFAGVGVALVVAGLRRSHGQESAGEARIKSGPEAEAFAAALRRESDIIAASFEEASLLLTVVDQIERKNVSRAIKTIRKSLDCSSADAAILAKEVGRVTRELKTGARR
jgi:hypothetical protein